MDNSTEFKGRAKEAAGSLTDDKDLKREGRAEQHAGEAKDSVDEAADSVKDRIDGAVDKVKEMLHRDQK
jgi:uncharacterized protein YjbJ (UPF0337 family)